MTLVRKTVSTSCGRICEEYVASLLEASTLNLFSDGRCPPTLFSKGHRRRNYLRKFFSFNLAKGGGVLKSPTHRTDVSTLESK